MRRFYATGASSKHVFPALVFITDERLNPHTVFRMVGALSVVSVRGFGAGDGSMDESGRRRVRPLA
jgi:hypothetical protein